MTLIKHIAFIGLKSLSNLKQFISSSKFDKDIMDKDLACYLEDIDNEHYLYSRESVIRCRIKIISTAKNFSERMKHFRKIFNLVRKNDYTKISLEITEEKERDVLDKYKIIKHFMEAIIRVDLK